MMVEIEGTLRGIKESIDELSPEFGIKFTPPTVDEQSVINVDNKLLLAAFIAESELRPGEIGALIVIGALEDITVKPIIQARRRKYPVLPVMQKTCNQCYGEQIVGLEPTWQRIGNTTIPPRTCCTELFKGDNRKATLEGPVEIWKLYWPKQLPKDRGAWDFSLWLIHDRTLQIDEVMYYNPAFASVKVMYSGTNITKEGTGIRR